MDRFKPEYDSYDIVYDRVNSYLHVDNSVSQEEPPKLPTYPLFEGFEYTQAKGAIVFIVAHLHMIGSDASMRLLARLFGDQSDAPLIAQICASKLWRDLNAANGTVKYDPVVWCTFIDDIQFRVTENIFATAGVAKFANYVDDKLSVVAGLSSRQFAKILAVCSIVRNISERDKKTTDALVTQYIAPFIKKPVENIFTYDLDREHVKDDEEFWASFLSAATYNGVPIAPRAVSTKAIPRFVDQNAMYEATGLHITADDSTSSSQSTTTIVTPTPATAAVPKKVMVAPFIEHNHPVVDDVKLLELLKTEIAEIPQYSPNVSYEIEHDVYTDVVLPFAKDLPMYGVRLDKALVYIYTAFFSGTDAAWSNACMLVFKGTKGYKPMKRSALLNLSPELVMSLVRPIADNAMSQYLYKMSAKVIGKFIPQNMTRDNKTIASVFLNIMYDTTTWEARWPYQNTAAIKDELNALLSKHQWLTESLRASLIAEAIYKFWGKNVTAK